MKPNIFFANSTQNRIRYSVAKNIGVRMTVKTAGGRHFHPAQNQGAARYETVDIVT
jgi:hypothetical protein